MEYSSLRAHHVHILHKLHCAKDGFRGQLKLLRDLVWKRGLVLAMYRVRYAVVAKDNLNSLKYRSKILDQLEHGVEDGGVEGEGEGKGKGKSESEIEGATAMDVDVKPVSIDDTSVLPIPVVTQDLPQNQHRDSQLKKMH